ncbi:hypothetical protein [Metabacillus litoralis]|uniref:hypothetical protein n=1 Tax=Metabacillus litoralis TaxID=152268 RepID=UPI0013CE96C9|nr:hypothetical protein [Metabacillus litoralis]
MNSEKGQTLITVLMVSLIFTVLGLTIVAASINSNQRTNVRIEDIELTAEANKKLNEGIAEFIRVASKIELKDHELYSGTFDSNNFDSIIEKLAEQHINVKDISKSEEYKIQTTKYFTRIFEFSYLSKNDDAAFAKQITRKVFLSPTPSFLKYAIGSGPDGTIDLLGASEIDGDLFSGSLNTKNITTFVDVNGILKEKDTLYPRIYGNIYLKNTFNGSDSFPTTIDQLKEVFDEKSNLTITKDTSEFIEVDFENTMAQLFNKLSYGFTDTMFESKADVHSSLESFLRKCANRIRTPNIDIEPTISGTCSNEIDLLYFDLDKGNDYFDILDNKIKSSSKIPRTYVYANAIGNSQLEEPSTSNYRPLYIKEGSLNMHEDSWLIVHGDLFIIPQNRTIELDGNIIVTGNLYIEGNDDEWNKSEDDNIEVNSTIYVLGETEITNTNIKGLNDKQLVLISKGDLQINRINEFKNLPEELIEVEKLDDLKETKGLGILDAYFYTQKRAELYGVGSLFLIKGGLFAKEHLTVNAIRQNEINKESDKDNKIDLNQSIDSVAYQRRSDQKSRFQVLQDLTVLTDQIDSLPKTNSYQIYLNEPIIINVSD